MIVSTSFADVGAGVATSGNTSYFVLVEALSTRGTPVAYNTSRTLNPSTPTIVSNTPNPDGSIVQIVQPGQTLGSLSMAYNVPLADILKLNRLTLTSTIFVNQKIIIRAANTPHSYSAHLHPDHPPHNYPLGQLPYPRLNQPTFLPHPHHHRPCLPPLREEP